MASKLEIRKLLKDSLMSGSQIDIIIAKISEQVQRDLNTMEDYYCKYKCLKYCLDMWVEKCTGQLKNLEPEYLSEVLEEINALTIKALRPKQFPPELRLLSRNKAFEILEDFCQKYIPLEARQERQTILETFKSKVWNNVLENIEGYKDARDYLETFQTLLVECGIPKSELIATLQMQNLGNPLDEDDLILIKSCVRKLHRRYENDPIIKKLMTLTDRLDHAAESEKLIVKNKLGLRLMYFLKPADVALKDGILTVCGCALSISEVLPQILSFLRNNDDIIQEINLFSPDAIIVDQDLNTEEFRGVNLVLSTTKLIISGNHVWDFSGIVGHSAFSSPPQKAINPLQNGLDGRDGEPGKSGGNVHILVTTVVTNGADSSLRIISNGGNGGWGQPGGEGGDGINGEDGDNFTTIDEDKFKAMIPKVSRFNERQSHKNQLKCYQSLIDIRKLENGTLKENKFDYDNPLGERFVYQCIATAAGAEAGFSIYEGPLGSQIFGFHAWYFGSPGTEGTDGGHGGRGGRGGAAGYAGEINIQQRSIKGLNESSSIGQPFQITVTKIDGNPGKDAQAGKNGKPGRPGRKGTDYACVHPFSTFHGRKFYKGALIKRSHESKIEPSPYCGYAKSKIHFENSQTDFTRLKNEHKRCEINARAPLKTSQKQRSILHSNTEHQFQQHCRRYFLNLELEHDVLNGLKGPIQSSSLSVQSAVRTLQIATRIFDFNPKAPVAPPRHKRLKEQTERLKYSISYSGTDCAEMNRQTHSLSAETNPLLKLTLSLAPTNCKNAEAIKYQFQDAIYGAEDKTALSVLDCKKLIEVIDQIDDISSNQTQQIRSFLFFNLRYRVLEDLHSKIQLLPEIRLGKIRKFDTNFHLFYIRSGGQLENNLTSSTFHSQVAEDVEKYLDSDMQTHSGEAVFHTSVLFMALKASVLEKGLEKFSKIMDRFEKYSLKYLKKLSTTSTSSSNRDDINAPEHSTNTLAKLEDTFLKWFLNKEGIDEQHHAKVCENLSKKLNKWLCKHETLEDYVSLLAANGGNISDSDFEILSTVYAVNILIYREENDGVRQISSTKPIIKDSKTKKGVTSTLHLLKTPTGFAPLVQTPTIRTHQAQIFLEFLNETSRPDFFDEFEINDKYNAIDCCFMNRKFTWSKLYFDGAPSADLNSLTESLIKIIPKVQNAVITSLITSCRFQNRFLEAFVNRLTWQEANFSSQVLPELGIALLSSDEFDIVHLEWTVSSLPQKDWLLEIFITLIQQIFRNIKQPLFQFQLQKWKKNFENLDPIGLLLLGEKLAVSVQDKRPLSESESTVEYQHLTNTIDRISTTVSEITLSPLDLYVELFDLRLQDWPKQLTNIKIRKTFQSLNSEWMRDESNKDFKKCIYYASSLHNEFPNFVDECLRILRKIKQSRPREDIDSKILIEIFSNYYQGHWSVCSDNISLNFEEIESLEYFYTMLAHQNDSRLITRGERMRDEILKFIAQDRNTTLSQLDVQRILFALREEPKSGFGFLDATSSPKDALRKWSQRVRKLPLSEKPSLSEMIYCISQGIRICRGFHLRDTQKVTVLTMLLDDRRNILSQVATGEGKSLIVVTWAIIKALLGRMSDVVTSSPILAERDAEENKDVYDVFQVSVGHNSSCDVEARKLAYKNEVVYGDVANFQRDYLLNKYHDINILGERSALENLCIMVDEVDSMLLDKGNSVLYLSHKPAGMEALNPLFIFIWKTMNLSSNPEEPVTFDMVKKAVLSEMYTVILPSKLSCLETLENQDGNDIGLQIHQALKERGFIDDLSRFKSVTGNKPSLPKHLSRFENAVWYIIKSEKLRRRDFSIPNHLEDFVDLHLSTWISSAFRAIELTPGKEYIVDTTSRSFVTPDKEPKVIIVDRDTGVDLFQSQWNNGLHQFLQLKHQCAFSNLSLKAIFISNVSYFKNYYAISGLTGTLGSEVERNFLKKTYAVDFVNIPTATPKRFVEELPIVTDSLEEWREKIAEMATAVASGKDGVQLQRSVLIICESINEADYLYAGMVKRGHARKNSAIPIPSNQIHVYKRSYERFSVLLENEKEKKLGVGEIIISTNLAGRGTDIKITDELNENGGLCVILSYLPANIRIEQQAFGRSARKGQNGSGILIILNRGITSDQSDEITMVELKNERDEAEVLSLSLMESQFYDIICEESLFNIFGEHFQRIKPTVRESFNKTAIQDIVLDSIIDMWAFWLDHTMTKKISFEDAVKNLKRVLRKYDAQETPNFLDLLETPTHLVDVGKLYLDNSMWSQILGSIVTDNSYVDLALPFFDKAIAVLGPSSSLQVIPEYYKAYALTLQKEKSWSELESTFRSVERGFRALIAEECFNISVVTSISEKLHQTSSFVQVETFKEQRKNMIALYQLFIDSIHDIIGSTLLPAHFHSLSMTNLDEVSELLSQMTQAGVIKNCAVISSLPPCNEYGTPGGVTNQLLYKSLNPDLQALEEIAQGYGLRFPELHEVIVSLREECEKEEQRSNDDLRQFLHYRLKLPSRSEFWEALVNSKVLSSVQTVGIICDHVASKLVVDPVFKKLQQMRQISDIFALEVKGKVFYKRLPHTTTHIKSRFPAFQIHQSLTDAEANEGIKDLEDRGMIKIAQYGEWRSENLDDLMPEFEYSFGYSLNFDYVLKLLAEKGVPTDYLDYGLFHHLVEKGLITSPALLAHTNFQDVDWGKYSFFKNEFIDIIQVLCAYRIGVLFLDKEMNRKESNTGMDLSFMNIDPCSSLVNDLFNAGILKRYQCQNSNLKSVAETVSTLKLEDVGSLFNRIGISQRGSKEAFWFYLIDKGLLKVEEMGYADQELVEIGKLNIPKSFECIGEPWNAPEIINFLKVRRTLIHETETVVSIFEQVSSKLNLIKEPAGDLEKIETKIPKSSKSKMHSEILLFHSMGLDSTIAFYDRKWSTAKRKGLSTSLYKSGFVQIAAGVAISVHCLSFGTFSGQLLINQGVGDMCIALTNVFLDKMSSDCYGKSTGNTLATTYLSLISPQASSFLLESRFLSNRFGMKICSKLIICGDSAWHKVASDAGHQLGNEVATILTSKPAFFKYEQEVAVSIKLKYNELLGLIQSSILKQSEDFTNSEVITSLYNLVGLDDARLEIFLIIEQQEESPEWQQVERVIENLSRRELELAKNLPFNKKKSVGVSARLFSGNESGIERVESIVEEIRLVVHQYLHSCVRKIEQRFEKFSHELRPEIKYQSKVIACEIADSLRHRIEDILNKMLLDPIYTTITNNFLRDADASLIRQLSQCRKNLVRGFSSLASSAKRQFLLRPQVHPRSTPRLSESIGDRDPIQELRLKRLYQKLFELEQICNDPTIISKLVDAELYCGSVLLQACANEYNCKISLKELDGNRVFKESSVSPSNPRQGEPSAEISVEVPLITWPDQSVLSADNIIETRQKTQRNLLDALLTSLTKCEINDEMTREDFRSQISRVIQSDVNILMTLRNQRVKEI